MSLIFSRSVITTGIIPSRSVSIRGFDDVEKIFSKFVIEWLITPVSLCIQLLSSLMLMMSLCYFFIKVGE